MTVGSGLFSQARPKNANLVYKGKGGIPGEIGLLRQQVLSAFAPMADICVEEYLAPVAASSSALMAATASSTSAVTLLASTSGTFTAATLASMLTAPRQIQFTTTISGTNKNPATATVFGLDENGVQQTEVVNIPTTATNVLTKYFYTALISVSMPAGTGTTSTLAIGVGSKIGLANTIRTRANVPALLHEFCQVGTTLAAQAATTITAGGGTLTVASTSGFPSTGTISVPTSTGACTVAYTGTSPTTFTTCTGGNGTQTPVAGTIILTGANVPLGTASGAVQSGTINLETAAGTQATVTGTGDLTVAGTLAELATNTLIVGFDEGTLVTVTFTTPASAAAVASQINTVIGITGTATLSSSKYLVLTSATDGVLSRVNISAESTALGLLGLTAGEPEAIGTGNGAHGAYSPYVAPNGVNNYAIYYEANPVVNVGPTTKGVVNEPAAYDP